MLENARLLVSELVANSIEHVREGGEIELRLELSDGVLRVEVLDAAPGFSPPRRGAGPTGWGLHSRTPVSRWAIDNDGRARVWFELLNGRLTFARYRDLPLCVAAAAPGLLLLALFIPLALVLGIWLGGHPDWLPGFARELSSPTATAASTRRRSTRSSATTTARSIATRC